MGYTNREAQIARSIFQEQEAYSNHVEYEFKIWKGKSSFLIPRLTSSNPSVHRDSSWLRYAAKSGSARS
jgi:hypothetical protein